jgi:AraC-like DNA-binding protein
MSTINVIDEIKILTQIFDKILQIELQHEGSFEELSLAEQEATSVAIKAVRAHVLKSEPEIARLISALENISNLEITRGYRLFHARKIACDALAAYKDALPQKAISC